MMLCNLTLEGAVFLIALKQVVIFECSKGATDKLKVPDKNFMAET